MAKYSVRIELHGASEEHYNKLHKAMWNAGFRRVVMSADNKLYLLPTGSYIRTTTETIQQTFDAAKAAANSTGKSSWVWMVEWTDGQFALKEVTKDPDQP